MLKNTADQTITVLLLDTSGVAVTTGTTTVNVLGDNGTQGAGAGVVAHKGNGVWSYVPTQAETNYDNVSYLFTNSGAVSVNLNIDPYPFTISAAGYLNANMMEINANGGLVGDGSTTPIGKA